MSSRSLLLVLALTLPTILSAQLTTKGNQAWGQGFGGLAETPESGDEFGFAIATGDFDGDNYMDAAIGAPGEDNNRGVVHVLFGVAAGLTSIDGQIWRQGQAGVPGNDENGDRFGAALAAGDFNGDGFADLAMAAPGEDSTAGGVTVLYGSAGVGLTVLGAQGWNQDSLEGSGSSSGDAFGFSLAVGNFNNDDYDDLVVGAPGESNSGGIIHVIYGSATGLTSNGNQRWHQDVNGIEGGRENGDSFGYSLATGKLNNDPFDDIIVGVPGEDSGRGNIHVLFGSSGGITNGGNKRWAQGQDGIPDDDENNDAFGFTVAAADFNGDGYSDIAVSSIGEDSGRGNVIVIPGSASGPTSTGSQRWRQNDGGIGDERESNDRFGISLAAADFNLDGFADLAIGVDGEDGDRGIIHVIYGTESGLNAAGNKIFAQGWQGMQGQALTGDAFGYAMAAGDFGGDFAYDLLIGSPGESDGNSVGVVQTLLGNEKPVLNAVVGAGLGIPLVETVSHKALATLFGTGFTFAEGRDVSGADLVNGNLPTIFEDACLELDGQRVPFLGLYPDQINFQVNAPNKSTATLRLIRNCVAMGDPFYPVVSDPLTISLAPVNPDFFTSDIRMPGGQKWVAAINQTTLKRVGPTLLGAEFEPAKPGDIVAIYVTGLGETNPPFNPGVLPPNNAAGAASVTAPVTVTIDGVQATVLYAGTAPGFAGLYQINVVMPLTPNVGNVRISMTSTAGGPVATTPNNGFIAVQ